MKIVIAGAHGVGKTTFAKSLAKKLKFHYLPDIVREEAVPKGFIINENTPPEVQLWLISRQWELETLTPKGWVADKCLFDYLVYGKIALGDKFKNFQKTIKQVVRRNTCYDVVFYLPIEFPMTLDGIRSENEKFRKQIDSYYKKTLKQLGVEYTILSGSPKQRITQALKYLKK